MNDDLISAYIDGELDADKRALVEHWLASDAGAGARLKRFRESDAALRLAVPRISAPENDPLVALLNSDRERPGVAALRNWGVRVAALAAACLVGVVAGRTVGAPAPGSPLALPQNVQHFLESTESGREVRVDGAAMQVVLSVMTDDGPCRLFNADYVDASVETVACREDGVWRVRARAPRPAGASEGYVTAGSNAAIDATLAGLGGVEALDADQEAVAIASGWRLS